MIRSIVRRKRNNGAEVFVAPWSQNSPSGGLQLHFAPWRRKPGTEQALKVSGSISRLLLCGEYAAYYMLFLATANNESIDPNSLRRHIDFCLLVERDKHIMTH